MTVQGKTPSQPTSDIGTPEEGHEKQHPEQHDRLKETTEKIWGGTKHVWSTATFKANQYKKLVQKKIDQSAIHKKIHVAHGELGKLIDDLRETEEKDILNMLEVKETLKRIDELKAEAVAIEEEVEQIRAEEPPQEHSREVEKEQEKSL
jgi:hypothetical protein